MKNFRLTPLGKIMLLLLILLLLSGFKHLSKMVLDDSKTDKNFNVKASAMTEDIKTEPIYINKVSSLTEDNEKILDNINISINFNPDSAIINKKYLLALDIIAQLANASRHYNIKIDGYTADLSKSGNTEYDKKLSLNRAKSIADYLYKNGIPHEKMILSGNGIDNPLGDNNTRYGRSQNRRADISFILSKKGGE